MELLKDKYKEEANELISAMEKCLLRMEDNADDPSLVEDVFRNMHTLKGNSAMLGYRTIADFTHHLESVYELVRSGEAKISRQIVNVTLSALDHLSMLIRNENPSTEKEKEYHEVMSQMVAELAGSFQNNKENNLPGNNSTNTAALQKEDGTNIYTIQFAPNIDFFLSGCNPLNIINALQQHGECSITSNINNIPVLEDCEPDQCYTSWTIVLTTNASLKTIKEEFAYAEDRCSLSITMAEDLSQSIVSGDDMIIHADKFTTQKIHPAENKKILNEKISKKTIISSIRVPSERLDNQMSLVSELMTLQAKLATITEQYPQSELMTINESLEKISTRLRDNAFSMCLVPVENMITPFHRLVRDLAAGLNKEIDFITEGTETELDKNIMEGLSDPLMHLIRNSIDHGIEDRQGRMQAGKPSHGKIIFRAFCAGTNVFIEIQDDGKGLDPEKIRNKAIQKGIISAEENLTDKEIFNLIFLPGFSTAEQVSEISGRGVGMDVVKRKIADIRGQIKITSEVNVGTTITIKLPITVSIIDGLMVKINDADFVIPLSSVERCYEIPAGRELNRFNNLIILDGEQIPFISLSEEFDEITHTQSAREIVIISYDEKRVGLIVDRIVGKFQAVLKPLGRYFLHMDNISGATILGDGKIALVLDANNVTEQFLHKKRIAICQ